MCGFRDDAAFDAFLAPYRPLPADFRLSQEMDADRLARLLDRIGPAIMVDAFGVRSGRLARGRPPPGPGESNRQHRADGPPFGHTPGFGPLEWGLTAVPVTYDPPCATPEEVRAADPASLRMPALAGLPVVVITGETSLFVKLADAAAHPGMREHFPVVAEALLTSASPGVRNLATLGGNLLQRTRCGCFRDVATPCNKREPGSGCPALDGRNRILAILGTSDNCVATYAGDFANALLVLDGQVRIAGPDGRADPRHRDPAQPRRAPLALSQGDGPREV